MGHSQPRGVGHESLGVLDIHYTMVAAQPSGGTKHLDLGTLISHHLGAQSLGGLRGRAAQWDAPIAPFID